MAIVNVNQGESIESALRRFKRRVMTEEIIKDAKKHAFFMPPGQKAKLKSALARKRNKKKARPRPPRDYPRLLQQQVNRPAARRPGSERLTPADTVRRWRSHLRQ